MLELPIFGHLTHPQYILSHVKNSVGDVTDRIYDVITFLSTYLYTKKVWGGLFC